MKVDSKTELIKLLDELIIETAKLVTIVKGFEPFMKDSKCYNIQVSQGALNLP